MPTTVRKNGTKVHKPADGAERIAAFRSIVDEKTYAVIDGVMVDLFSASAVVKVYDALSGPNRDRYAAFEAPKMAKIAFALMAESKK